MCACGISCLRCGRKLSPHPSSLLNEAIPPCGSCRPSGALGEPLLTKSLPTVIILSRDVTCAVHSTCFFHAPPLRSAMQNPYRKPAGIKIKQSHAPPTCSQMQSLMLFTQDTPNLTRVGSFPALRVSRSFRPLALRHASSAGSAAASSPRLSGQSRTPRRWLLYHPCDAGSCW